MVGFGLYCHFNNACLSQRCSPTLTLASVVLPAKVARKHAWLASAIDSILTIGLGLGIRVIVNITILENVGLAGSIVGFWEGLVLYHYLNKYPTVYDPYIAYALRILLDIATMDDLFRLALILLWTGLGFLLSDVAPILWEKSGLELVWNNLCEDMSTLNTKLFDKSSPTSSRSKAHYVSSASSSSHTSHISSISRTSSPSHIRFHHFPSDTSSSYLKSSSPAHTYTKSSNSSSRGSFSPIRPSPLGPRSSSPVSSSYRSSSSSTLSSMTATSQTILPVPPPRDPNRRLTSKRFPGAFQDDVSEASTIPPSSPPPSPPRGTFVPLSMRSHSQVVTSSSSSAISARRAAREARTERSERTNDWRTEVSASVHPAQTLVEIPEVAPAPPPPQPPPRPSSAAAIPTPPPQPPLTRGQTTPGTRELFLSRRSSVVTEARPPVERPAPTQDGATEWETVDDDGRTATVAETDLPPSYHEEYSHAAEEVGEEEEKEPEPEPEPPVPKVDTKGRLRSAMKLRTEIASLQKRLRAVEKERAQAKANNKSALALQKKIERDQLRGEIEKLKKKHDKRMVSLYNEGEITDRINLADLDDETAVEELEKAIETLISSSFEPTDAAGPSGSADSLLGATTLYVEVDSASKKGAVTQAMIEHGIPVTTDGITNILIVTLPRA